MVGVQSQKRWCRKRVGQASCRRRIRIDVGRTVIDCVIINRTVVDWEVMVWAVIIRAVIIWAVIIWAVINWGIATAIVPYVAPFTYHAQE